MMKRKQFWCCALALVSGLLLSSSVYGFTFTDSFSNLDNWTTYGSPSPQRLALVNDSTGVFDNNGDATDNSGAISVQTFGLNGGFTIQSDVYLDFSDTNGCYAEAAIGIANPTSPDNDPYIYFSISAMGHSCGTIAASLLGHAYFFGEFATESGSMSFYPTEEHPATFLADDYANGWHTLKIVVDASSKIRFYVDDVLIYTDAQSISGTVATGTLPLWLGSRSSGDAGKAYHAYVAITTSCDPPSAPSLTSPGISAIVCNTSVTFVWNDVVGATNYQMQVDDNSNFGSPETDLGFTPPTHSVSIVLTDNCQPQYWRVRAKNACNWGDWSTVRTVTVCSALIAPTLDTPASGTVDVEQPVALNWDDIGGTSYYQVQVDTTDDFASPLVIDRHRTVSSDSVSDLVGSTRYYWRVRAASSCATSAWSSTYNFTTAICNVPDAAVLVAPADGDSNQTQPLTLNWSDAAGALTYRVQIDNNSDFSGTVFDNKVTLSTMSVTGLTVGTKFYWRVRAHNGCGWADWSDTSWFKTCYVVEVPTLLYPANADSNVAQPITARWDSLTAATKYWVQVDDDSSFGSPVYNDSTAKARVVLPTLSEDVSYYWRVKARNDCGWGSWSASNRSFKAASGCPTPAPPALNSPENDVSSLRLPVHMDWSVAGDHLYQLKVDDTITLVSPVIETQLAVSNYTITSLDTNKSYYWAVRTHNSCGWGTWSSVRKFTIGIATAVEEVAAGHYPAQFVLSQNYPNPFNPSTAIEFTLPRSGQVTLEVYDIVGRKVRTLVSEAVTAGTKRVIWDGCNSDGAAVASGVYFYRITASDFSETRKMLLLK
jgi:hypothetical protein